jgi:hypothetical protein
MNTDARADCLGLDIRSLVLEWSLRLGHWSLPDTWSLVIDNWNFAPKARFGLSKHLTLHVGKHRPKELSLLGEQHRQMLRQSHNKLHREMHAPSLAALHGKMLAKLLAALHRKTLAPLLDSMLDSKHRSLQAAMHPALLGQRQPGRRPPVHPPYGRIVVRNDPTTTYRCVLVAMATHICGPSHSTRLYDIVE